MIQVTLFLDCQVRGKLRVVLHPELGAVVCVCERERVEVSNSLSRLWRVADSPAIYINTYICIYSKML
jgi:hypothetical protein